jgi:putative phosphoribosyl transferase
MIHLPFADRLEAGKLLAVELSGRKLSDAVVVALARGGVPVGFAVAHRLGLLLDVLVARKPGVLWQRELAMGAIAGTARVSNEGLLADLGVSAEEVEMAIAREQSEMKRRDGLDREGQPAVDFSGKTAILVDDGLATGSTMLASLRHVRNVRAAKAIVAVPVGSRDACDHLRREADDVVCLATPEFFYAVGEWYRDFHQVSDNEVRDLLAESRVRFAKPEATMAN